MAETKTCPKCGVELPDKAPDGICPKCLMQAGLESESDSGVAYFASQAPFSETPSVSYQPPKAEELAHRFDQFEILELLGYGGMGAVYKARQKSLDRLVALKIIRPSAAGGPGFSERFSREAKALARLSHSSIVTVYDFGESDGLYYLVMEYVDGVNLRQTMQAGPLDPGEALQIVPRICDALQYAHDEGIVHRDIKPENILIDRRGRVKIADFGLAKLVGGETTDPTLTGTRQVMGTIRYMAPEQMESSRNVDHRADIYSLGVVFYEMLTGEIPIGHFAPPSKKATIDARLDEVVLRALASEPERRFQQADELKSSVEQITSHPDVQVPLPAERASSQQGVGVSTIFEREAANLRNWFVAEPRDTAGQPPTLPALPMVVLCIAGCLMLLLPWMKLEIDAKTVVRGVTVLLANPVERTLAGSDRWPGMATAAAFGCFALLLLVTPSTQRLTVLRAGVMTAIAAFALLHTLLFKMDLESSNYPVSITTKSYTTESRPPNLSEINHRITYREGFYGSLGLSLVLLVLSATAVRHAAVWRSQTKRDRKQPADPDKPRFSRKAIVGACWAALSIPTLLVVALTPLFDIFPTSYAARRGTIGAVDNDIMWLFPLTLSALLTPFGTTTLGLIALGDIRHSHGRMTGLELAFFDAVLFPTLLANAAIIGCFYLVGVKTPFENRVVMVATGLLLSIVVDYFVLRRCWRGVKESVDVSGTTKEDKSDTAVALDKQIDSAAPLTSVQFSLPEEMAIGPQVQFHFTGLGYRLIDERENEWIFQRGRKWAGLWLTDIANYYTRLSVRSVTQPGRGLRVRCSWVVKFYGGFVFGGDITQLQAEAHELEALLRGCSVSTLSDPNTLPVTSTSVTGSLPAGAAFAKNVTHISERRFLSKILIGLLLAICLVGMIALLRSIGGTSDSLTARIDSARVISMLSERDEALKAVALDAAATGEAEIAMQAIRWMSIDKNRDNAASQCAVKLAEIGQRDEAADVVRMISYVHVRDETLRKLAELK